uniref:glycerophosphodiester phosphodiesterase domain-containing protein 5-like n=1 Tax=Ciona intestinalis TaxID=7719 RepID=UPI000180CCD9|nr:glycerophosphodiester phosphodiesterase domain-containing protein 5-like [Ciona intestinalis]|eukprot:XP_004226004.2 glycerophosphodiester phosphodiesterase domain-containing protein 5-like [Ciona intestinalis]
MKCTILQCSSCIYSCQCKPSGQTAKYEVFIESFSYFILILILLFSTTWLYSWSVTNNDVDTINYFFYEQLGSWFNWYILILSISVLIVAYLLTLFISGLLSVLLNPHRSLHMSLFHKIVVCITSGLGIAGYVLLFMFWSQLLDQVAVSLTIIGWFIQISVLLLWVCSFFILQNIAKLYHNKLTRSILAVAYFSIFIFLCLSPLLIKSPCIGNHALQSHKPVLFGHRGSPTEAPENTILSFKKAAKNQVYGFESDVRISLDGVPFLMHDPTLQRTTNVKDIFPTRKHHDAETFTWKDLQQLNAGQWYLHDNPYLSNGALNKSDKEEISLQKIPLLVELAQLATMHNTSIMFDLFKPPKDHPHHGDYVNITLQSLLTSGINQTQVFWIYSEQQDLVNKIAPNFKLVSRTYFKNLSSFGFDAINMEFPYINKSMTDEVQVIAYTINDYWAYSWTWCTGAWAVTTDFSNRFLHVNQPCWYLTQTQYTAIWLSIDAVCVMIILISGYFMYRNYKKTSHKMFNNSSGQLYSGTYNRDIEGMELHTGTFGQ